MAFKQMREPQDQKCERRFCRQGKVDLFILLICTIQHGMQVITYLIGNLSVVKQ